MFKFGDKVCYTTSSDEWFAGAERIWYNGIVEEVLVAINLPSGKRKIIPINEVTAGWSRKGVTE